MTSTYGRSLPDIFTDLIAQLATLLRKEGQLARAEISENISAAAAGLGFVVGGAVLLIPALVILLETAVDAMVKGGLSVLGAGLIAGGVTLLIGLALLLMGVSRFRAEKLLPRRTFEQLQQDAAAAKQQMRQNHDEQRAA
jgi:UPF0716 family protein affecting phage T7 exclusion